jgi:membrane protease YdiL (CAAX protease family)
MNIAMQRLAKRAAHAGHGNRLRIAARLLLPLLLLEVALWAPLRVGILFGVAALWYVAYQLWQAAGTAHELGLGVRGLLQHSWMVGVTLLGSGLILATAYFTGTLHRLWGLQNPMLAVAGYAVWALVQEFMLQCFCLRMLRAMVSRVTALLLSGVIFAVAHLPNPSLTLVTFFAGVGFTALYARKKNLYVVALIHAVLGLTLAVSAPDAWFHGMSVGRDFDFAKTPPAAVAATMPRVR